MALPTLVGGHHYEGSLRSLVVRETVCLFVVINPENPYFASYRVGCNNGGEGGFFSKVKQLVWKCIVTLKFCIFKFSCFSPYPCGIQEKQELFPRISTGILPIKPRMHVCACLWAVGIYKKTWIQTYFELVTVDFVEIFHHFAFWRHGTRLASFVIVPKNCIFWGASFMLIKNLATLVPEKLQGFCETLLYRCYTLLPWVVKWTLLLLLLSKK